MAILPVYTYDAKVLRSKTRDIDKPGADITKLVLDMFETMKRANGLGLAANQVGKGHSMFVIDLSEAEGHENDKPLVFINPEITELWGDDVLFDEGCLSVPGIREDILRPELLHIKFRDANFQESELEAEGLLARVIQHEYDHLDGIFFTDRLRGLKKRLIIPALKKIVKGDTDADYPIASLKQMYG
jgi:peptide deformylase